MRLNGYSIDEGFSFRIIREGPDGRRRSEPLPPPKQEIQALAVKSADRPFPIMISGSE